MRTKDAIATRCSCRAFRPYQISKRELDILLQGANAAPVGMGKYEDLVLTIVQSKDVLNQIDGEGAKYFGTANLHPLYGAPTLITISGAATDTQARDVAMCNASCIIENIMVTAADIGLGSCYLMGVTTAIRDNQEICQRLNVPAGFVPCASVAIGYPEKENELRELVTDKITVEYVK